MINTGSTPPILPASLLLILYLLIPLIVHPTCPLVLLYSFISLHFLQIRIVLQSQTLSFSQDQYNHPFYWDCPASTTHKHTLLLCLLPCGSSCKLFTPTPFLPSPPSPCTLISPAQLFFPSSSHFSIVLAQQCHFISSHATGFPF